MSHRRRIAASAIIIAEVESADGAAPPPVPTLPPGYRHSIRPCGPPQEAPRATVVVCVA
jgi:hypothetical protein